MLYLQYKMLIDHYIEKSETHGSEALFGEKKSRAFHQSQSRNFDRLLIYTVDKFLKDKEIWNKN